MRWSESPNGGALWFRIRGPGEYATTTARRSNDWPSIVWASESTRHVLGTDGVPAPKSFQLDLRTGSGLAIGPTSAVSASGVAGWQAIQSTEAMPDADAGRRRELTGRDGLDQR